MSIDQKRPLALSLNAFAQQKAQDQIQLLGKALPATVVSNTNSIVTVSFDINSGFTLPQVTIPLFGPEYVRYPIQPGCLGVVLPIDAYIGGVSGLGGGVASLVTPANLSSLVFLPIANTAWSGVDANAVTIYGPNGVVARDTGSNSTFVLTPTSITMIGANSVTVQSGGATLVLNSSGSYSLSGSTGTIASSGSLSITDAGHGTSPTIMNAAWSALVTWLNTHNHTSEAPGTPTTVPINPFTGTSIAP